MRWSRFGPAVLVVVGVFVFVACANGALPDRNVNDPRSPSAPEALVSGPVSASAASSSGPAVVHHHTDDQPDATAP